MSARPRTAAARRVPPAPRRLAAVSAPAAAAPPAAESMRERFAATMTRLLDEDPRVALVLADISAAAFAAAAARHPDRVVNVGIREQLMVGVAGGLALEGLRPVVHSYAPFLVERPFEQVKLDLGHQGVGAVLVSVGASHDWAAGGSTHRSPGDVALLDILEDWHVHVPGHPAEADALLSHAVGAEGRHYVRLSESRGAVPRPVVPGRLDVVRRGGGATVVAVGPLLDAALAATEGLDVTVLYATTVRPFDAATLLTTLGRPDVVLVEPYLAGTSTRVVAEALAHVPHRVLGLGVGRREIRRYGEAAEHDRAHGLDAAGIRASLAGFLAGPG